MKRVSFTLTEIADRENLLLAVHRAALGKRRRPEVTLFLAELDENLADLGETIRDGSVRVGQAQEFHIRDPKPRVIHAPCFRERVLHHAIMNLVGPVLDRSLVDDTFACRVGKGSIAAVQRAQDHVRRFTWFAKLDVRQYFASIHHATLKGALARKIRSREFRDLIGRIIDAYSTQPGRGLPIGALTSQCFANFYLNALDRFLLETLRVRGMVRYMDDFVFWGDSRHEVRRSDTACREFLHDVLGLTAKPGMQINRSSQGLTLCGFRVYPGTIRLAASRRRRYRHVKRKWEVHWLKGHVDGLELQRGYASALAMTQHADAGLWRRGVGLEHGGWRDDV